MIQSATLSRPDLIRNDVLPRGGAHLFAFVLLLTLDLRAAGYVLSPSVAAINASHDWLYHGFWMPLHIFLARFAGVVFARHVAAGLAESTPAVVRHIRERAEQVTSMRGLAGGLLLVAPFAVADFVAGQEYVREHFPEQGYAAALVPAMWMIEWLATAQVWLFVLGV